MCLQSYLLDQRGETLACWCWGLIRLERPLFFVSLFYQYCVTQVFVFVYCCSFFPFLLSPPPPFFVKILLFLTPLTLQSSNAFIESLFLLISFYTYLLLSIFYYLSFPSQPLHPLAQCLPSLFRIPPHLLVSLLSSGTKFEDPSLLIVVSLPFYCSFWILWSVLFFFVVYKFFLVSFLL